MVKSDLALITLLRTRNLIKYYDKLLVVECINLAIKAEFFGFLNSQMKLKNDNDRLGTVFASIEVYR
jgi:hypothetical protein